MKIHPLGLVTDFFFLLLHIELFCNQHTLMKHITHPATFIFVSTLLFLCLMSCQREEERLKEEPYQVLNSILSTHEVLFEDVINVLSKEVGLTEEDIAPYKKEINMAAMRARKYKAYVITYHTTDPNGHPVIASGVVYYPKTGSPRGVIEAVSYNKDKRKCPSKQLANLEVLQGMAGFIVLAPDLIGCGSTESMAIPYLYLDNVAKVSADFRLAATELVRNVYGRAMPDWTMVSGISLAASEAWALARYYHIHPELGVHVNQIWLSGGAYNPQLVLDTQLQTRHAEYAFIPNVLYSINHYEELGLKLKEYFRGELSEHYEEWCTGNMAILDLTERLGTDLTQYLNIDLFNDDNPDYQRIKKCIEKMVVPNDWVPSCKVHIYHGRNDTFVPIACSEELVKYLQSVGANVDYVVTEEGHFETTITMGTELVKILYN